MGERLTIVEHIRHGEQRTTRGRHHFITVKRVPAAKLHVHAAFSEDRQVSFAINLGRIPAWEVREWVSVVQNAGHVVPVGIVTKEAVDAETEVQFIALLKSIFQDEVILITLPLVGLIVRIHTEIEAVLRLTRVACKAVLDPSVELDWAIFQAEHAVQEGGRGIFLGSTFGSGFRTCGLTTSKSTFRSGQAQLDIGRAR